VKRREFFTLIGGAATWPLAARAQQRERIRRIGVFMNLGADDPEAQVRAASFCEAHRATLCADPVVQCGLREACHF
jgi:putative ABC transport system substrate-binding protein